MGSDAFQPGHIYTPVTTADGEIAYTDSIPIQGGIADSDLQGKVDDDFTNDDTDETANCPMMLPIIPKIPLPPPPKPNPKKPPPPAPPAQQGPVTLGALSAQYESNGDPGSVNLKGHISDPGGWSYGQYQIATKTGTMGTFLNSLKKNNPAMFARLEAAGGAKGALAGTQKFINAWKLEAQQDRQGFAAVQHNFIQQTHYDVVKNNIRKQDKFNLDAHSNALKNAIWSMAVQHGTSGATSIFNGAIGKNDPNKMSDQQLLKALYDERRYKVQNVYFTKMSAKKRARLVKSLVNRYNHEQRDAERMLDGEQNRLHGRVLPKPPVPEPAQPVQVP